VAAGEFNKPEGAEHGTGAALRRLAGTVEAPRPERTPRVRVVSPAQEQNQPIPEEDASGGYDEALFAPSDRADEPITHGAPFGAGANFVALPYEDEFAFRRRVADTLESDGPDSLAPYIAKLRNGG